MSEKLLMKGNEVIGEAAIRAGCTHYFGYPITPQTELLEYMARELFKRGGCFVQAESEIGAINMVYGAACAGARCMTSSSSPGISLKMEGISYIAAAELPCVVVNISRGSPGLGTVYPSQSDYFQATKGGGHGDYRMLVLAPASVQEMADLTQDAFYLADKYRNPSMILGDGALGQMMEKVEFKEFKREPLPAKDWATTGMKGRAKNVITSLWIPPNVLEAHNLKLQKKYNRMKEEDTCWEEYNLKNAEYMVVAFGTSSRICKKAIDLARAEKIKVGLLRPITLFPYPSQPIAELAKKVKAVLVVEMNAGQMLEDVKLAVEGKVPVKFYGRIGGAVPSPPEVFEKIKELAKKK